MASIGAHAVSPTAAVYCATKYAVLAISEGLHQEVGGDIRVTVVSPGVTESELADSISDPAGRDFTGGDCPRGCLCNRTARGCGCKRNHRASNCKHLLSAAPASSSVVV
jgi:NAD(P)-dependent dehydrogenase (short-subunit alcohol dehydrogenase family)